MKTKTTHRLIAVLMLLIMLLPFVPFTALFEAYALINEYLAPRELAEVEKLLISDDFSDTTKYDYASGKPTAKGKNNAGQTVSENFTVTAKGGASGTLRIKRNVKYGAGEQTYTFPYDAIPVGTQKLKISFDFYVNAYVSDSSAVTSNKYDGIFISYAKTSNAQTQGFSLAGLRYADGKGASEGSEYHGATRTDAAGYYWKQREHYIGSAAASTDRSGKNYLGTGSANTHNITMYLEAGTQGKIYVDGVRYLTADEVENGVENWKLTSTNKEPAFATDLGGKLGLVLLQEAADVTIDNLNVWEIVEEEVETANDSRILIYDDFQTDIGYSASSSTNGAYSATLEGGALTLQQINSGSTRSAYLFPYDPILEQEKLTVSFRFTLLNTQTYASGLHLAYGAKTDYSGGTYKEACYNYGTAGIRLDGREEHVGRRLGGVPKFQKREKFYLDEDGEILLTGEYLAAGTHTMTIRINNVDDGTSCAYVYIDGQRYGAETWNKNSKTTSEYQYMHNLSGLFGIDLNKVGTKVAIDDFLVYKGHGELPNSPVSTVSSAQAARNMLVYDSFDDPYLHEYYNANDVWGVWKDANGVDDHTKSGNTGNISSVSNGALHLDCTSPNNVSVANDYYPLPYSIPSNVTAFTAEIEFSISREDNTIDEVLNSFMLCYGGADDPTSTTRDKQNVFYCGIKSGRYRHDMAIGGNSGTSDGGYASPGYAHAWWGTLKEGGEDGKTPNGTYKRYQSNINLYNSGDAPGLFGGYLPGETYTLVVYVTETMSFAYIKEYPPENITDFASLAWSGKYDAVDKFLTDGKQRVAGTLGIFVENQCEYHIDTIAVYDGIRVPNIERDTSYLFDNFTATSTFAYPTLTGNVTANVLSDGQMAYKRLIGDAQTAYVRDFGYLSISQTGTDDITTLKPTRYATPLSLPAGTVSFTSELQFSLDGISNCTCADDASCSHYIDVMMSYGETADGYWVGGLRFRKTKVVEFAMYVKADGTYVRAYRDFSTAFGWSALQTNTSIPTTGLTGTGGYTVIENSKCKQEAQIYTMALTVSPTTQSVALTAPDGTTYTSEYGDTKDIRQWTIHDGDSSHANCIFSPRYVWGTQTDGTKLAFSGVENAPLTTPSAAQSAKINFRNLRDGDLGIFLINQQAVAGNINYHSLRVSYIENKDVLTTGTTIFYEDFAGEDAADKYDMNDGKHVTTVTNGMLKLDTLDTGRLTAYMLPVVLKDVNAFTAEIVFAIAGTPPVVNDYPSIDLMLMYGTPQKGTDAEGNPIYSDSYGWVSGYRFGTGTEWFACQQDDGQPRRAYRSPTNGGNLNGGVLGYNSTQDQIAPTVNKLYKLVVQVKNGAATSYIEDYFNFDINDTSYTMDSVRANGNDLPTNAAKIISDTANLEQFANTLEGGIGLYNLHKDTTLLIDSISISAGLGTQASNKKIADGTVLYENDFSEANLDDYTGQDGYKAALVDGALSLKRTDATYKDMYLLPGSNVSGAKSMTVTFDFFAKAGGISTTGKTSNILFGYDANGAYNYSYAGARFENTEGKTYELNGRVVTLYDTEGNIVSSNETYYRRNWLKTMGTGGIIGTNEAPTTTAATLYTGADYEDDAWHTVTLYITGQKAVMYIGGERIVQRTYGDGTYNSAGDFAHEMYSAIEGNDKLNTSLIGGMLGFWLGAEDTEVLIDNITVVAGTLDARTVLTDTDFAEYRAGQGTIPATNINAKKDNLYARSSELSTGISYGGAATATTRMLWDANSITLYTEVTDATNVASDRVIYYIDEGRAIDYMTDSAYSLTVYRNGTYATENASVAEKLLVNVKDNGANGYIIELKLQMVTLGTDYLRAGDDIGFNFLVSDDSKNGNLGYTTWFAGYGEFQLTPDNLARINLAYYATPTEDTTPVAMILSTVAFAAVALVGALGVAHVLGKKRHI